MPTPHCTREGPEVLVHAPTTWFAPACKNEVCHWTWTKVNLPNCVEDFRFNRVFSVCVFVTPAAILGLQSANTTSRAAQNKIEFESPIKVIASATVTITATAALFE